MGLSIKMQQQLGYFQISTQKVFDPSLWGNSQNGRHKYRPRPPCPPTKNNKISMDSAPTGVVAQFLKIGLSEVDHDGDQWCRW